MMKLTINMKTSHDTTQTVGLPSCLAVLASVTNILDRLESCSLPNLEVLDSLSNFDDDTCTLVAGALGAELGHWWHAPVLHHEVDIAHTETGDIELDQDLLWANLGYWDILDFNLLSCQCLWLRGTGRSRMMDTYAEVRTRVDYNASLAGLWNDWRRLLQVHSLGSRHACDLLNGKWLYVYHKDCKDHRST